MGVETWFDTNTGLVKKIPEVVAPSHSVGLEWGDQPMSEASR